MSMVEALGAMYGSRDMPTPADHVLLVSMDAENKSIVNFSFFDRKPDEDNLTWLYAAADNTLETWQRGFGGQGRMALLVCGAETMEEAQTLCDEVTNHMGRNLEEGPHWFRMVCDAERNAQLVRRGNGMDVLVDQGKMPDMRPLLEEHGFATHPDSAESWKAQYSPLPSPAWESTTLGAQWERTAPAERAHMVDERLRVVAAAGDLDSPESVKAMQEISMIANSGVEGRDLVLRSALADQRQANAALETFRRAPQNEQAAVAAAVGAAYALHGRGTQTTDLVCSYADTQPEHRIMVNLARAVASNEENRPRVRSAMVASMDGDLNVAQEKWAKKHPGVFSEYEDISVMTTAETDTRGPDVD